MNNNKGLVNRRMFIFWLAGCIIIISRRPETVFYPQLWSEDGFIFLPEALNLGLHSFIKPYAGYLHLVPRTITYLALWLSETSGHGITWVPAIMNVCAVSISSFCAVFICSSRFNRMGSLYFRMLMSLFVLLFPDAYEVFGSVTNLHWWLGILAFFLIGDMLQTKKMPTRTDIALLSVIVLTSPNGLIALPAVVLAYFYVHGTKPSCDLCKVFLIFLLAAVQFVFIWTTRVAGDNSLTALFHNSVDFVFVQLFGHLLFGSTIADTGLLIAGGGLFFVMVFFGWRYFKKLYIPLAFLCIIILLTVLGADLQMYKLGRYLFVPTVIIVCILLSELKETVQRKRNRYGMPEIALLCIVFSLISIRVVRNYAIPRLAKHPWKEQAALFDRQGKTCFHFPINPEFWSVGFPSSQDINQYLPETSLPIVMDDSHIVELEDLVQNAGLFTVTGAHPVIIYQLPATANIAYCHIRFASPLLVNKIQMLFLPEEGAGFPMAFNVAENNMLCVNKNMQSVNVKQVRFDFWDTVQKSSFEIKKLDFYTNK